jgi:ABC-type glutathione transport system ATPase component
MYFQLTLRNMNAPLTDEKKRFRFVMIALAVSVLLFILMTSEWERPAFPTFILTPTKDIQSEKSNRRKPMIKSLFGLTKEPFNRSELTLLPQQKHISEIVNIHSQQGGFSVVIGEPGVGKSVLREHIEALDKERDTSVVSCARTLHTRLRAPTVGTYKSCISWPIHLKLRCQKNS